MHAGESGSPIFAGVPRTRDNEGQVGADERVVPVQREGAIRVNSQAIVTIVAIFLPIGSDSPFI